MMASVTLVQLAAALLLQIPAPPESTSSQPRVVIEPEDYVLGPVTLRATLQPEDMPFVRADFFVDGVAVCQVERLPIECLYDAGQQVVPRRVRVAITLNDGTRLSDGFESKGISVAESTGVRNVFVPVVVRDWRGRFMNGLTKDSFLIFEDGVPQSVDLFMAEDVPLDLTLAIDISGSMSAIITQVQAAAKELSDRLKPIDHVNLVAFNERVFTLTGRDADAIERAKAIDDLRPQGGTALYDAMVRGIALLRQQMSRRALIVLSDGKDEHSLSTIEGVEERLAASDVALFFVTYAPKKSTENVQQRLERLAESTGGRTVRVERAADLGDLFRHIVDDLSKHYLLSYTPTRKDLAGNFRKIEVKLTGKRDRHDIRARAGYRAVTSALE